MAKENRRCASHENSRRLVESTAKADLASMDRPKMATCSWSIVTESHPWGITWKVSKQLMMNRVPTLLATMRRLTNVTRNMPMSLKLLLDRHTARNVLRLVDMHHFQRRLELRVQWGSRRQNHVEIIQKKRDICCGLLDSVETMFNIKMKISARPSSPLILEPTEDVDSGVVFDAYHQRQDHR